MTITTTSVIIMAISISTTTAATTNNTMSSHYHPSPVDELTVTSGTGNVLKLGVWLSATWVHRVIGSHDAHVYVWLVWSSKSSEEKVLTLDRQFT